MTNMTGYSTDNFARTFATLAETWPDSPRELLPLRQKALANLQALGLPNRKNEDWKYTSLRALSEGEFRLVPPTESAAAKVRLPDFVQAGDVCFVFVDGHFRGDLSQNAEKISSQVRCTPLAKAWTDSKLSAKIYVFDEKRQTTAFEAMGAAFAYDGLLVEVPAKTNVIEIIHVIHIQQAAGERSAVFPVLQVRVGALSEVKITETFLGQSEGEYLVSAGGRMELGEGAKTQHIRIVQEGAKGSHIGATRVTLQRNSKFEQMIYSQSGKLVRHTATADLLGEGAEARLNGLYLAEGDQHVDHYTAVDHRVPHTTSHQLYKGILADQSRGVFKGRVKVHAGAQGTVAMQQNKNLLLSTDAEIDTKPQLEIDADDVKCTHGATIGQMAEDEIFYLLSRGIPRQRALHLLCEGFAQDVFSESENKTGRKLLSSLVTDFFAGGHFGV